MNNEYVFIYIYLHINLDLERAAKRGTVTEAESAAKASAKFVYIVKRKVILLENFRQFSVKSDSMVSL